MAGGFYSTDYRKKFALDLQLTNRWFAERKRNTFSWTISPRYRFSDELSAIYSLSGQNATDDVGYVDNVNDTTIGLPAGAPGAMTAIIFGVRDVNTITNMLSTIYIFSSKMSLKLSARHYWSRAIYSHYDKLDDKGKLVYTPGYTMNRDINFNTFNVFMSYVWQFRPGSEMTIVYQNSIFSPETAQFTSNYFTDLDYTFQNAQSNSLSVKIIYYLDYLNVRRVVSHKS